MPEFRILITRGAEKDLGKLPKRDKVKAIDAIRALSKQPRHSGAVKLKYKEGWRIRIGDYRIIYQINNTEKEIIIIGVKHRREVYRD